MARTGQRSKPSYGASLVLLHLQHDYPLLKLVSSAVRPFKWHLLDYNVLQHIPDKPAPAGAIVGCWPSDPLLHKLEEMNCPAVTLQGWTSQNPTYAAAVVFDYYAHGRLAAEHFAHRGLRDIAYIGHETMRIPQLYKGFNDKADELGLNCHLYKLPTDTGKKPEKTRRKYERRTVEIGKWLKTLPKPVGVLGYHINMSTRLLQSCFVSGLDVPEDVAILSATGDSLTCEIAPIPISSIDIDLERQVNTAVTLLNDLMNGKPAPDRPIVIPPKGVIERQSSNILNLKDKRVSRAVQFLWNNLDQPITIEDAARSLGIPRSTLDRLARKHLGRSLNRELQRKRLEVCCNLLKTTDLSFSEIVEQTGFRSRGYLHVFFRENMEMSPSEYRSQFRSG